MTREVEMVAQRARGRWLTLVVLLALILAAVPPGRAAAAGCTVTNTNDDGAGSLRECLYHAVSGDTIAITATGTITLARTLTIGQSLTLTGPGAGQLAISGNNAVRVIEITDGTVTISGVTIRDGKGDSSLGGGIRNRGTLTLADSVVTNNAADYDGGGIGNGYRANLTVTNSVIANNAANRGGGIGTDTSSTVTILNSTVGGNLADGRYGSLDSGGGGIFMRESSSLTIANSTISGNSATRSGSGGGIFNSGGTVTIDRSTISGNSAASIAGSGGGIAHSSANPLTITNSTISGNSADSGGGLQSFGPATLRFTTVTKNASTQAKDIINFGDTGGIAVNGGSARPVGEQTLQLIASVVIGNTNATGSAKSDCARLSSNAALISGGGNVVGSGTGCPSDGGGDTTASGAASVLHPDLANNGGPTRTHALVTGSPAIDRVPTANCADAGGKDQRGTDRPVGPACDSGAFEGAVAPPPNPCGQRFGDVPADHPACAAIEALADRGVIKGCDQEATPPLFCPDERTLRAQMAALIVRAMAWGAETPNNPFTDRCDPLVPANCVDPELWNAVGVLAGKEVARGYTDGPTCAPAAAPCYAPRDDVLHAQTISFITRAMVEKGYWTAATVDDGTVYPNIPAGSGHRLDFVTYTQNVGPVPGTAGATATFPQWDQPSTRAWFAQALWQAIQPRQ